MHYVIFVCPDGETVEHIGDIGMKSVEHLYDIVFGTMTDVLQVTEDVYRDIGSVDVIRLMCRTPPPQE